MSLKREIILDTETTGLDPRQGHRLIEIGCIEMINRLKTGKVFHVYLNPEREVPEEAFRIHGISSEFLQDKPLFAEIVEEFLEFLQESPLVIHNASFDVKFINAELERQRRKAIALQQTIDTLLIARKKFPGSPATLDALCKRYNIDSSRRTKHGALLDAELLADVYIELMGGTQSSMELTELSVLTSFSPLSLNRKPRLPRHFPLSEEEEKQHQLFLQKIKNALWHQEKHLNT